MTYQDILYDKRNRVATIAAEDGALAPYYCTPEGQEGVQAFLEKRRPNFRRLK